ncbi:unnamed protein product [Timema podura]|uniref:Uncharacterized protein n=1 Tax=Timema podura TaxID=61482 RepID=A0ABN7P6T7_TIMPD|nr:unnamed protein product [Timema podura]
MIGFAWDMLVAGDALKVKKVVINVSKLIHRTDTKFLSVALDSSLIRRGWIQDHSRSKKLLLLASHLSPGYLRVGGTAADCLIFNLMSDGRVEQDYTNLGQSYIRVDGGECAYEGNSCLQNRCEDFTMSGMVTISKDRDGRSVR